ncbi:hypothetical protein EHM76_05100 [bacterium]|nr:MAG: hypothetical protein EHM76_05100 [bacterium]
MVPKAERLPRTKHGSKTKPESWARGSANHAAKLSEDDVRAIRADSGATAKAIAAKYGVDASTIRLILKKETWRHVV